jgi:hypothetical protein
VRNIRAMDPKSIAAFKHLPKTDDFEFEVIERFPDYVIPVMDEKMNIISIETSVDFVKNKIRVRLIVVSKDYGIKL